MVAPVDPLEVGIQLVELPARAGPDELGLVEPDRRLGERLVAGAAARVGGRDRAAFVEEVSRMQIAISSASSAKSVQS